MEQDQIEIIIEISHIENVGGTKVKKIKNVLSINAWYDDIQIKGNYLSKIPEDERTPEMCFVAINYWGAALEFVPEKYKTPEMCLGAVKHNTPVDEGCSALAFVPKELITQEMCFEAIRHDYLGPVFFDEGFSVEPDYEAAIHFVPDKFKTPELCFKAITHCPISEPGYFNFIENGPADLPVANDSNHEPKTFVSMWVIDPKPITDLLNSPELFLKALKQIGMPNKYDNDAIELFKKLKCQRGNYEL